MTTEHLTIKKRGLLCKLTLPSIQVRRKHGAESDRVASDNDADSSMVAVTVCLVPKEYAANMMKLAQRIRDTHRRLSLPWDDAGGRIIPLAMMQEHASALASDISAYKAEVDTYADNHAAVKEAARLRLGPLFDENAYGTAEEVRAKLQPTLTYYPLPDSSDFRVDLDNDQIAYIRDDLDMHMRDKFEQAVSDVRNRIVTVIEQFIERVSNYHETRLPGGKVRVDRTFRDSVVTNITELLDIVPSLNITNDVEVARVAQQTRNALCVYEAASLRANAGLRDEVVAKAKELLGKLKR